MYKTRFFFFIGLLIMAWGAKNLYLEYSFIKNGIVAQGRVVDMQTNISTTKAKRNRGAATTYAPRVAFRAQDGQEYSHVPTLRSSHPDVRLGDLVPLVYNRENPNEARILQFQHTFGIGWFLACLGGTIMLYTGGAIYAQRKMLEFALTHQTSSPSMEA